MKRTLISLFFAAAAALVFSMPAASLPLADGTYTLGNHPDGNAAPPLYGLRLDGLDGDDSHEFTFSFTGNGAEMFMTIAGAQIHIFGTVFGGEDIGNAYDNPVLWDVDFTYTDAFIDGMLHEANTGTGTITPQGGTAIDLVAKSNGDFAFRLAQGHRGFADFSGWGWVNHSGGGLDNHIPASDWLFIVTGTPPSTVPEASGALLGLSGLLGLAWVGRRR